MVLLYSHIDIYPVAIIRTEEHRKVNCDYNKIPVKSRFHHFGYKHHKNTEYSINF